MDLKENIFNYATKELTQDAFLMWLLNNHNSDMDDVKEGSHLLLKEFLNIPLNQKIKIDCLKVISQEKGLDILVTCEVDKEKYVIAIEDKTNSTEHGDQLNRYRVHVNKEYAEYKNHAFIFYKTNLMTKEERESVTSKDWRIFDIESIKEIFSSITSKLNHYLLKSYVQYINYLYDDLKGPLPKKVTDWNLRHWHNYAVKEKWILPENIVVKYENYQDRYYVFNFCLKDELYNYPYLHLLTRDIQDGTFIIKLKMYEIKEDVLEKNLKRWKTNISKSKLFKNQYYKQQIGISIAKEEFETIEELISLLPKYLKEYISITEK